VLHIMNENRFDSFSRHLGTQSSRRGVLRVVLALASGAFLAACGGGDEPQTQKPDVPEIPELTCRDLSDETMQTCGRLSAESVADEYALCGDPCSRDVNSTQCKSCIEPITKKVQVELINCLNKSCSSRSETSSLPRSPASVARNPSAGESPRQEAEARSITLSSSCNTGAYLACLGAMGAILAIRLSAVAGKCNDFTGGEPRIFRGCFIAGATGAAVATASRVLYCTLQFLCAPGWSCCQGTCCHTDMCESCVDGTCKSQCQSPKICNGLGACVCPIQTTACGDQCCRLGEACCGGKCVSTECSPGQTFNAAKCICECKPTYAGEVIQICGGRCCSNVACLGDGCLPRSNLGCGKSGCAANQCAYIDSSGRIFCR